ncbi:MAG: hypothetical protein QXZ43_01420 [Candidatus Aenigmatarchaeota archaeon]
MFQNFQFNIETIGFLSALIFSILLYFGKIISDTKVEKYTKLDFYIEGLFFSLIYLFLPFIIGYYLFSNKWLNFPIWAYIFIQILILVFLSYNFIAHNFLRKFGLVGEFKNSLKAKIEEIRNKRTVVSRFISKEKEIWFKKRFGHDFIQLSILVFYDIPINFFGNKKILLIFSFTSFLAVFYTISSNFILSASSFVISFFILTMIAFTYGFGDAYYPPSRITLVDGKIIEGNIIKFSDDFIFVLNENEKIFVNKDQIKTIKQSLWKEKEK